MALGALYVVLGSVFPFLPAFASVPVETDLIVAVLVAGPGLVVCYGGYRLPRTDIRPEFHRTIVRWCLTGIASILAILGLIEIVTGLRDPVQNVLILTALASVAGLGIGTYHARSQTRYRELELRNQELEHTKAELERTVDDLRTANQRLEQFTYAASHDLQEPLRMVSSYLQLLERRYEDELDEDATEFIDFAVGGADRMRAIVESLLEYSRVSTSGNPLQPTDSEAVLETVLDELADRIEQTDATITTDDLPTVQTDPDQLAIVYENLLSNALTFSGDDPPRVHISAEQDDDKWRFSVSDEGIGVEPEYHDQIFSVFETYHPEGEQSDVGAGGVGLALCERIIERHGGDIWVESTGENGATFYFTLPSVLDQQHDPISPQQSEGS